MLSFAMISQRRIASLINLFALQGAALVAASVLLGYAGNNHESTVSAGLTLVLKVMLIPWLLYRHPQAQRALGRRAADQRADADDRGHRPGDLLLQPGLAGVAPVAFLSAA